MSGLLRFIGSLCIFVFIIVTFMGIEFVDELPQEYVSIADDVKNNKWLILIAGIILSIFGTVTKIKKTQKRYQQQGHTNTTIDRVNDLADAASIDNRFLKKDFVREQNINKAQQFANKQSGHLKDLALTLDWSPMLNGGSNFKTTFLKQVKSSRLEVAKSKGGLLFSAVFAAVGLGVGILVTYSMYQESGLDWELLFPILFGGVFSVIGFAMLYWPRPRVFDIRTGWFWAGNKSLAREQDFMKLDKSARLSDIAAIQIVTERISKSKGGSYNSWEINIVSNEGKRLNVMDHGNKLSIDEDARILSEFLGVPVWENT